MNAKSNIYQKLNNFRLSIGAIRKDKTNPYHKSKYADINTILAVITDKLSEAGLIDVDTTRVDENGQLWLNTKIIDVDNPDSFIEMETPLLLKDKNNPQALGSALTYNRRYNRVTLLGLEQEDDDGNAAAGLKQNNQTTIKQKTNSNEATVKQSVRSRFLNFVLSKGISKEKLAEFTDYMKSINFDITKDEVKEQLLAQDARLTKMINSFLSISKDENIA